MSKLGDQLGRAPLPHTDAKARVLDSVSVRGTRPARRMPAWGVAALIGGGVAVLIGLSLTPPGRAVAGDIGRLVGIGDEPTNPPVLGERAVVIGSGEAARSFPYEIVASTNHNATRNEEVCVEVDFPGTRPEVSAGNCLTPSDVPLEIYARNPTLLPVPEEFAPDGEVIVQGMVPVGSEVSLEYTSVDGSTGAATVHMSELTDELGERIDVAGRASFFLTVLPSGILRGSEGDPTQLTCESVEESLARIRYRVLDAGGGTVVDATLAAIEPAAPSTLGLVLLTHPPVGFTSDYSQGARPPACELDGPPARERVAPSH